MFTPQVVLSVYYSLLGGMALSHFSKKENKPYHPGVFDGPMSAFPILLV